MGPRCALMGVHAVAAGAVLTASASTVVSVVIRAVFSVGEVRFSTMVLLFFVRCDRRLELVNQLAEL
jgi:hypothetical protein